MDYEHIKGLAEKAAAAAERVRALEMMNTATEIEARIAQEAQYRIALDVHEKAEAAYRTVMDALSAEELNELVATHNRNAI